MNARLVYSGASSHPIESAGTRAGSWFPICLIPFFEGEAGYSGIIAEYTASLSIRLNVDMTTVISYSRHVNPKLQDKIRDLCRAVLQITLG